MASEVAIRMKLRKADAAKLNEIIANSTDDTEVRVAKEYLERFTEGAEPAQFQLTPEEEVRLSAAETKFKERQAARKTPSKSDGSMRQSAAKRSSSPVPTDDKSVRETKRVSLEESIEVPGLKVNMECTVKETGEKAIVTRIYKSGDGKEKCMLKIGDGKLVKKRVTAVEFNK